MSWQPPPTYPPTTSPYTAPDPTTTTAPPDPGIGVAPTSCRHAAGTAALHSPPVALASCLQTTFRL